MSASQEHPAFGAADLTNCERELIHLAGSIQPHGVLLVLHEPEMVVAQASMNCESLLGIEHAALLGRRLADINARLAEQAATLAKSSLLMLPQPARFDVVLNGRPLALDAALHRLPRIGLVVELAAAGMHDGVAQADLPQLLSETVGRITAADSFAELGDAVVRSVRTLTGYDRVMVYQFDAEGHGEVLAEARRDDLEPFLGQRYPASDIPQRARELYLRNRVRVLVDVAYEPVPIVPRQSPYSGDELDMSLCALRSMSPLHLQYLQNMGVTATLVTSLVREGKLWGLIACHHYSAKNVASETRAACELLSEVASTRISAIDNRAQIHAELFVRELEQSLIRAAADTGDWRDAFFDNPTATLLRPFDACGAALCYEGAILTAGETPSRSDLRALMQWLQQQETPSLFQTASLQQLNDNLAHLAPTATGVLAIELARRDGEYLMWFRKEQLRMVTWAGNPGKPIRVGNDPRELSPRRSFAAWSEIVRDKAKPWSPAELATAQAIRRSLVDVITQVRALRALVANRQSTATLGEIDAASEAVILANGDGDVLVVNAAFHRLLQRPLPLLDRLDDLVALCRDPVGMAEAVRSIGAARKPWRGELRLLHGAHDEIAVALRADAVQGARGDVLGYILVFNDLRQQEEANAVRTRLERAIADPPDAAPLEGVTQKVTKDFNQLLAAVLANAGTAVAQIANASAEGHTSELLRELEIATRRATELTAQILGTVSRSNAPR